MDSRPNWRNKAAFSHFSDAVRMLPQTFVELGKTGWVKGMGGGVRIVGAIIT